MRPDWEMSTILKLRNNDLYFYNYIHFLAIEIWMGEVEEYEDDIDDFQEALEEATATTIYIMLDRDIEDFSYEEYKEEMSKAQKRLKRAMKKRARKT